MMITKRLLAVLVLGVGLYASDKTPVSDDNLTDKVKLKLAQDTVVKGGGLTIDVKNGVVTLSGKVENPNQKSKAEKLAKKVPGVKGVNNQIVVTHAP
jgi:osmotically-inducible protein OsmY